MALAVSNNFESGLADTTAISTGNSGGGAGTGFDLITNSAAGASSTFSSTAIRGALSGLFVTGSTSATAKAIWSTALGGTYSRLYGMFAFEPGSLPSVQTAIVRFLAGGSQAARFTIDAAGTVSLRTSASGLISGATSVGTMTANSSKWWIKYDITFGTSGSGTILIYYSQPVGQAADETLTFSSASLLSTAIDTVEHGVCAGTTNASVRLDDINVNDAGIPTGPQISGTAAATFGALSGTAAGFTTVEATAAGSFGSLAAAATGIVAVLVSGTAVGAFGALAATGAGTIGASAVMGVAVASFGGMTDSAAGTIPSVAVAAAQFGGLNATAFIPLPVYTFSPLQRKQTVMLQGSLRVSFPVSMTVWKDSSGVWHCQETPSNEVLNAASVLLAVSGRPQVVTAALAAELVAAGVGTVKVSYG